MILDFRFTILDLYIVVYKRNEVCLIENIYWNLYNSPLMKKRAFCLNSHNKTCYVCNSYQIADCVNITLCYR